MIEPRHLSIARLFGEPHTFTVPKYQRSYAWDEEQVDDFLDDLQKCYDAALNGERRHHFFGGVVSIARSVTGSSRAECEVVDGQQRLATFIILMSIVVKICKKLSLEATASGDMQNKTLADHRDNRLKKTYLIFEDEVNRQPINVDKITLSNADNQFFKDMIYNQSPSATRDSHKRLDRTFGKIEKKIDGLINGVASISDKLDILKNIEDILIDDFTVIHIRTDSKPEAYRLFQVLNDRGISLTEGDLLRARTLELLDNSSFLTQQTTAETTWDRILSNSPKTTEEFLRTYYSSVHGRRPKPTGLFDDFMDAFFPQHTASPLTVANADTIVTTISDMEKELVIYRNLIAGDWPYARRTIDLWDTDRLNLLIRELPHINCLPLLLAASKLTQRKFANLVNIIERFVFRYKIICGAHVTPLTNMYYRHAVQIRQNPATYSVNSFKTDLRTLLMRAPDAVFETHLNQLTYSPSRGNKQIRYFLTTLEHYYRWYKRGSNGNPKCLDKSRVFDFTNTSIEHIYPQNASGTTRNAAMESLKHQLGNLTFLGRDDNALVDNSNFAAKKLILEASSVQMNRKIAENTSWSTTEVSSNKSTLIDIAKKIFTV
jgi:hypothetical protein